MNHAATFTRRRFTQAVLIATATLTLAACQDRTEGEAASGGGPPGKGAAVSDQEAYELAAQAHGFTVGALMAANTVYVLFDPNCPHCAELWAASRPLLGRLRMVWMPVALLGKTSAPLGAAILGAPDPEAAMAQNEAALLSRQDGLPLGNPAPEVLAKVQANTELFQRLNAESVPLILFRHAGSGAFGRHAGSLTTAELAALAGV